MVIEHDLGVIKIIDPGAKVMGSYIAQFLKKCLLGSKPAG